MGAMGVRRRHHVVVVGGLAGIACAKRLESRFWTGTADAHEHLGVRDAQVLRADLVRAARLIGSTSRASSRHRPHQREHD